MAKEYCMAVKCSFRKYVDFNKAFCMLPRCPMKQTKIIGKPEPVKKETVQSIIAKSKKNGLIP